MTEEIKKENPKLPVGALADIKAFSLDIQSAQQRLQIYLNGVFVGMSLQGDWNVNTETGELTEVPKKG